MTDNVNHPAHYETNGPFECIELTHYYNFCVGNAIKYVWRHMDKGKPFEDLSKALWYVSWELDYTNDPVIQQPYPLSNDKLFVLANTDFAHMREFWDALIIRSLPNMRAAIEHRAEALTAGGKLERFQSGVKPLRHGHVRAHRQGEKLFVLRKHSNTPAIVGEAMRQRGFDWDNGTIRRIEQGERRIHLDEAIALLETYGYTQSNMFTAINYILKESVNNE